VESWPGQRTFTTLLQSQRLAIAFLFFWLVLELWHESITFSTVCMFVHYFDIVCVTLKPWRRHRGAVAAPGRSTAVADPDWTGEWCPRPGFPWPTGTARLDWIGGWRPRSVLLLHCLFIIFLAGMSAFFILFLSLVLFVLLDVESCLCFLW
jgi:hypothetical protein